MLEELRNYENLGSPEYFWILFNLLTAKDAKPWTRASIEKHFNTQYINGVSIFDGCVDMALKVGILAIGKDDLVTIDGDFNQSLFNEKYLQFKITEKILQAVQQDDKFFEIFCPENLSYDIVYRSIQISNSAFTFRYANFKQLLIDFGFLKPHPDKAIRMLIINPQFRSMFDRQVLPEVKRRKIGIDELEKSLAQKQIYGDEAEDFALAYEKERLSNHDLLEKVEKISTYDVAAGYDLVSFNDSSSQELDRFIEVKSYAGTPSFYWSRNEMYQAKLKRHRYFLYLIDRTKMNEKGYKPFVIQNPHNSVYLSEGWSKVPSVMFVTKL